MDSESENGAAESKGPTSRRLEERLRRLPKAVPWGVAGLLVVMAVAVAVRLFRLGTVPANLTADESGFFMTGWHILEGTGPGLFGFDGSPSPNLCNYLIAGTMKVFGAGIVGGRMTPVVLSLGTLVVFFLLARQWLSYLASSLAALLLATNVWFLHFSRTTWSNMNSGLFAVGGALMLTLAIRKGRWYYYVGAGAFAALGLYGYFSGRLVIFLLLSYLPFALLLNRGRRRQILQGYAIMVFTCFILFLPQIRSTIDNWDTFNKRPDAVLIFNQQIPYLGESDMGRIVMRQIVWAARAFLLIDDGGVMAHGLMSRYNPPGHALLDPFVRCLFFLGLAGAAWKWRQTALWWVMFLGPVATIQVFSSFTPDGARGLIVAPFMFLFVGQGIDLLLHAGRRMSARIRWANVGVAAVLCGTAALFAGADVREYFDWIGTPEAVAARRPAVTLEQFPLWQSLEREAAREGPLVFDFPRWCSVRDANGGTADSAAEGLCNAFAGGQNPVCTDASTKTPAERDAQRLSDIDKLSGALKEYRDRHGLFPYTAGNAQPLCGSPQSDAGCKLDEFLQPLPRAPLSGRGCYEYWYASDGQSFVLYAALETKEVVGGQCPSVPQRFSGVERLYCLSGP